MVVVQGTVVAVAVAEGVDHTSDSAVVAAVAAAAAAAVVVAAAAH